MKPEKVLSGNRIITCFDEKRLTGDKVLLTYFMAGDPSLEESAEILLTAANSGADILEIGLPFSDPLADGPVIEAAGLRSLDRGFRVSQIFQLVSMIRKNSDIPIIIMSYYNPIYRLGLAKFAAAARAAGVDGLIVPDAPFGVDHELYQACVLEGLELIPLVVSTTDQRRLKAIGARNPAFIYCVSRDGTTGVQQQLDQGIAAYLTRVGQTTGVPVAVGFGIGTGSQARVLAPNCDGVVVGSALVKLVEHHQGEPQKMQQQIREKVQELKDALNSSSKGTDRGDHRG